MGWIRKILIRKKINELALIAEKYSQPDPENEDTQEKLRGVSGK